MKRTSNSTWINLPATISFSHKWPCAHSCLPIRHHAKHHMRTDSFELFSAQQMKWFCNQTTKTVWNECTWCCLKPHGRPGQTGKSDKIYRHHNAQTMMHDALGVGFVSGCRCWEQGAEELIIHQATVGRLINIYAPSGSSANGCCRWQSLCTGAAFSSGLGGKQCVAQSAPPLYYQRWLPEAEKSFWWMYEHLLDEIHFLGFWRAAASVCWNEKGKMIVWILHQSPSPHLF